MIRIFELSPARILRTLFWLRSCLLVALVLTVVIAWRYVALDLPMRPIGLALLAMLIWNAVCYWRLTRGWIVTGLELFWHLAVDISILTVLLYWTGGAGNPLVSLYLVHIVIAASALAVPLAWGIIVMSIGLYTWLLAYHVALPPAGAAFGGDFSLHVIGMWLTFILSAALIGVFVAAIADVARERERALSRSREEVLRAEKIVALGALAAGAAHEINTPLGTMTLLVDDLRERYADDPELVEDIDRIRDQIDLSARRLGNLVEVAAGAADAPPAPTSLRTLVERSVEDWHVSRPEIRLTFDVDPGFHDPRVVDERTLSQSIASLLNNAADASVDNDRRDVRVGAFADRSELVVTIDDEGVGMGPEQAERAGRAVYSSKSSGLGVGLVLSNATVGRLGGQVSIEPRRGGGSRTEVRVPLRGLEWESDHD